MKLLASKFGNLNSNSKLLLTYDQFEQFLKIISISKQHPSLRSEKIKLFFHCLSQGLKIQFLISPAQMSRSNSNYSLANNQDLNESNSSLDLSIKEALDTLKSDNKKSSNGSGRSSISPRPAIRAYSNPSTPKSRSFRTPELNPKVKIPALLPPAQSYKSISRFKNKVPGELDEFLETERQVQKEVLSVKVNLKSRETKKFNDKDPKAISRRFEENKQKPFELYKNLKQDPKYSSKEKNLSLLINKIQSHRNFIIRLKRSQFSQTFVLGLVFRMWESKVKLKKQADPI
jgi:hypothetical protein